MTHFAVMAFLIVCFMGGLTWICLPGSRYRSLATTVFAFLSFAAFAGSVESTGQPRPLFLEWRNVMEAPIVGLSWNEEARVVWVWVMQGGAPVAYSLPWPEDQKKMGELQDKWRRKGQTGDEFELSMEGDVAKVRPPQPMPEKTE